MLSVLIGDRHSRRLMAYSAAAMYGASAFLGLVEGFIPGGPSFSLVPGLVALGVVIMLLLVGPRLPWWVLASLGPIGVALIAVALATSPGAGDGAVLYMWPALWAAFFFGRVGVIAIVACIGVAHAVVLTVLPPGDGFGDRWLDVVVSVSVVAGVVWFLAAKYSELLTTVEAEARTDKVTAVLNRRGFEDQASRHAAMANREASSIAVVIFDVDLFKRVNDECGHEVGDQVLARVGSTLTDNCRKVDVVARFGGDEFVVLMPHGDARGAEAYTRRVRRALDDAGAAGMPAVRVSAGVAVATAPRSVEPVLQSADAALYEAKRTGRNRTVLSDATRTAHLLEAWSSRESARGSTTS